MRAALLDKRGRFAQAAGRSGPTLSEPHIPDLASHSLSDALDHAETALHALAGVLRR